MDPGRRGPAARAATGARFGRSSPVFGIVLLALTLLTARLGPALFCTFVAIVVGLAAVELATSLKRQGPAVKPIAAGAGAAAFAVGARLWGEVALLRMPALLFVACTGGLAIGFRRDLRPGAVRMLAALLLPAVYTGLAGAFLVLVRQGLQGTPMVEVFAGLAVAFRLGAWLGTRRAGTREAGAQGAAAAGANGARSRMGMVAGALACVVASPLLGLLLDHRPATVPMLGLGLFVGLAATVGTLGSGLLAGLPEPGAKPAPRPVLAQIEPALLAAPAFFYAFRLLLT